MPQHRTTAPMATTSALHWAVVKQARRLSVELQTGDGLLLVLTALDNFSCSAENF